MIRAVRSEADQAPYDIWQALADSTRRALIDRLAAGPLTTSALCASSPLSRFAIMKHLGVLEASGLVTSRKTGRVRTCRLETQRLAELDRWITRYHAAWHRRLDRLGDILNRKGDTQ